MSLAANPAAKNIDPEMPLTATPDSNENVVHVLTDEGNVYNNVNSRADSYDPAEEMDFVNEDFPKEITIDGRTFKLRNKPNKQIAATQATFAKQYNEKISYLPAEGVVTTDKTILEVSSNPEVTEEIIENLNNLKGIGVAEQKSSGLDRFLTTFYQTPNGNVAVNTKKRDAYVGLADYLSDKLNSVIMKQPKSEKDYKFFSGRKKFSDLVDIYDESGNVVRSDVPLSTIKKGDIISFKTILSGSLSKDKGSQFGNYLMEAIVPKGTSTMSVNVLNDLKADAYNRFMSEIENLLYRDAKFRVLNPDKIIKGSTGNKHYGFKVELMNPKVLIPAFVTLKLNQSQDESEE
jgi:hypothetical protein